MRHRGRYHMCWLTAHEREPELHYCPPVDRLADTRSDGEWQPAQSGLITGGADLLCDGRRAGPAILMRLALTSRRVPRLRRSGETHAEEAHSERSAAQGDLGRGVALGRQPYGQPAH